MDVDNPFLMDYLRRMNDVFDICEKLGRRELAATLGVGATAVSNAAVSGIFPAKWYAVVKDLCKQSNIDCPDELFNFIPKPILDVDACEALKEAS